jgi:hypothetical protein
MPYKYPGEHKERNRTYMQGYRARGLPFWSRIRREYGITQEEYGELLSKQNGKCAICGADNSGTRKKSGGYKRMCIDHDHKTGKVRGLLCTRCNLVLGYINDEPSLLPMFIEYLARVS